MSEENKYFKEAEEFSKRFSASDEEGRKRSSPEQWWAIKGLVVDALACGACLPLEVQWGLTKDGRFTKIALKILVPQDFVDQRNINIAKVQKQTDKG